MAKMTKEILNIVKEMFEKKEFILIDWVIYKKIKYNRITFYDEENNAQEIKIEILMECLENNNSNKDISEYVFNSFKKSLQEEEYIVEKVYKKLGEYTVVERYIVYKRYGGSHERGYIIFSITVKDVTYRTFAHRIIYYLVHGIWDDNKVINHKDSNKTNNNPENIELITQFENVIYSIRNYEIIISDSHLDDYIRNKYRLNDEKWKIFKEEVYKANEVLYNRDNN